MRLLLLLLLLIASTTCFANKIHVNPLATDTADGTTWARAWRSLQDGLDLAKTGDTVLVAAGTYGDLTSSDLYAFRLYNAITILGGYPNTGNPTDAQRNYVTNRTILNGAAGPNGYSTHVLWISRMSQPVVIDGLIFINSANVGVRIENSTDIHIRNTLFQSNWGYTISVDSSTATFTNCVLFKNDATPIYNSGNSNTSFYNCVITDNLGYERVIRNESASISFFNCTIANNSGIAIDGAGAGNITVKNSILWGNKVNGVMEGFDIKTVTQTVDVSHSITQSYFRSDINTILVNQYPRFVNELLPAGADNVFFTADDGLQLTIPCSPALNFGDNSLTGSSTKDIIGNPRIYNSGMVDLGAYEMQQVPGIPLKIVYVKSGATGANNGTSWANAFTTLQQALLYCADTIKIAAGTYVASNSKMDSTFSIESGRVLLGGYPATGNPSDADRNPKLHHTILKGNYFGDGQVQQPKLVKAYHVDSTTILDGLKFDNASANADLSGSGLAVAVDYGSKLKILNCDFRIDPANNIRLTGLMIYNNSSPYIYRCEFNTGLSENGGSAVGVGIGSHPVFAFCKWWGYSAKFDEHNALSVTQASVTLDSCVFWRNNLDAHATFVSSTAAILTVNNCIFRSSGNDAPLFRNTGNSTGTVSNSVFRNLLTLNSHPALYSDNSHLVYNKCLFDSTRLVMRNLNRSSPVLNNCLSVHGRFMWNRRSSPTINHSTIVNTYFPPNSLDISARQELVTNEDSSTLRANNTIFWSARLSPGKNDIYNQVISTNHPNNSQAILRNCLTQNFGTHGQNGNLVGKVPRFRRLDYILGDDGKLFTADDGLQLSNCSPAIDAGNNSFGTVFTTDILNNPRTVHGTIDMGAYELQGAIGTVGTYYVKKDGAGNQSGVNWQNAYSNLKDALCNACADTIRVAEGTYKAAATQRDSSFVIFRPLAIFGGYPATGNPGRDDRDAVKHPTILSGNIGAADDSLDNTALVMIVDGTIDSVHIEGFVIRDGYNSGSIAINAGGGAGLYVSYTNTGIYNCQFLNNRAFPFGAGLGISSYSWVTVNRCVFMGNSSSNEGGALSSDGYLRMSNCVFENNWAYGRGGAVKVNAGFDISNTVFYRNFTTVENNSGVGGGLYAAGSDGTVYNCTFVENKASFKSSMGGGGMFFGEFLPVKVRNCIFSKNTTGGSDSLLGADLDWRNYSLHHCILQDSRGPLNLLYNIAAPPGFVDAANPKGPDGLWLTQDDGFQLDYSSAAVDHGQNFIVANLPYDILGDDRIVFDSVDAGAYEYQNRPVALAGKDTVICTGGSAKIGKEGNPAHTYTWTSSPAGFNSSMQAPVVSPSAATTYYLQVSNGTDIKRDTILVSANSSLKPTVNVITDTVDVCAGSATRFIAIPLYEGADPAYQWQVNGTSVGTDTSVFITTDLQDGDLVHAVLTSSASCATPDTAESNRIRMDVTPVVVPEVTINGPVSFCPHDTVTFTLNPINGGPKPLFRWSHGGLHRQTSYDSSYTTNMIGDWTTVSVIMFSKAVCQVKGGDTASLAIETKPNQITSTAITASATSICGDRLVAFTAGAFGGGPNPVWQWKLNGNNVYTDSSIYRTDSLKNGDQVYVLMTSSAECPLDPVVESNKITMTVQDEIFPTISINTSQTEVTAGTAVIANAVVVNGNGSTHYTWYDSTNTHNWQTIPGATTATINYTPLKTGDKIYCMAHSNTNCMDLVTLTTGKVTFKVNAVTGINPVPAGNYGITNWPNPVSSFMMIDGLKLTDHWQMLEMISMDGRQKVLSKNIAGQTQVRLTIVQLKTGPYIVMLRKKSGEMVYLKFVKL